MTSSPKKIAFESILLETKDKFLRVTDFRDLLVEKLEIYQADKAQLRKWIYSNFITMEKQGRIEKRLVPGTKKWQYRLIDTPLKSSMTTDEESTDKDQLACSLDRLQEQLSESKRKSKIFISQLNTHKAIKESHPILLEYSAKKYKKIFEESYDLLGTIKALEETLSDHGRSVD